MFQMALVFLRVLTAAVLVYPSTPRLPAPFFIAWTIADAFVNTLGPIV